MVEKTNSVTIQIAFIEKALEVRKFNLRKRFNYPKHLLCVICGKIIVYPPWENKFC